jgi:hypothetical protein
VNKTLKKPGFIFLILSFAFLSKAQQTNCILQPSQFTIHFGSGNVGDINGDLSHYRRVYSSCPTDGHYSFAPYTSGCFHDDWHTVPEDHTAGDANGNMLLVNASPSASMFLNTPVIGLKGNTTYELALWLMNLCKPTNKCPFPLLPRLYIRLETSEGTIVANIVTGEVPRFEEPKWIQHRAFFTTPASTSGLVLVMKDNTPGGCGNDFALDDITFRECVKPVTQVAAIPKKTEAIKPPTTPKSVPKKTTTLPKKVIQAPQVIKSKVDTAAKEIPAIKQTQRIFPPPPLVLKNRQNTLAKKIETDAGEIKIELYDNGQIDGDTISIYHNNKLVKSHMRLSQKPISLTISIDPSEPHHEVIMVAENLGSIPPNTSVMIISTASNRYQVFISSSEQKNAKVVFELKK